MQDKRIHTESITTSDGRYGIIAFIGKIPSEGKSVTLPTMGMRQIGPVVPIGKACAANTGLISSRVQTRNNSSPIIQDPKSPRKDKRQLRGPAPTQNQNVDLQKTQAFSVFRFAASFGNRL